MKLKTRAVGPSRIRDDSDEPNNSLALRVVITELAHNVSHRNKQRGTKF